MTSDYGRQQIVDLLVEHCSTPVAGALLATFLGIPISPIPSGLLDVAKGKIQEKLQQRRAARYFEDLADKITTALAPVFLMEDRAHTSVEAVIIALATALRHGPTVQVLLERNMNPEQASTALLVQCCYITNGLSESERRMLERATRVAMQLLSQTVCSFPEFQAKFVAELLDRLTTITGDIGELIGRTETILANLAETGLDLSRQQLYEIEYRSALVRTLNYVELFGAEIPEEARRNSLSVAFLSLKLLQDTSFPMAAEDFLADAAEKRSRFLVRGDAGSGKSTLFRWIAIEAAKGLSREQRHTLRDELRTKDGQMRYIVDDDSEFDAEDTLAMYMISDYEEESGLARDSQAANEEADLADIMARSAKPAAALIDRQPPSPTFTKHALAPNEEGGTYGSASEEAKLLWRLRLPFLIRLRYCQGGCLPDPEQFPTHIVPEIGKPPNDLWVRECLKEGDAIVLFDGIDEVAKDDRGSIRIAIENFVSAYPDNVYIVSSRPKAAERGWLSNAGFVDAELAPLSETDKGQFIGRWHRSVSRELSRIGRPKDLTLSSIELQRALPLHPGLDQLASSPLLCAMICALHHGDVGYLPESLNELCDRFCRMFLIRDKQGGLRTGNVPEWYSEFSFDEMRAFVQSVAYEMVLRDASSLSTDELDQILSDTLRLLSRHRDVKVPDLRETLVERAGLLRETQVGHVDFVHNYLKEFLAAERFVQNNNFKLLARSCLDDVWYSVAIFAAGCNNEQFPTKLIASIKSLAAREPGPERRELNLVALACRGAAIHFEPRLDTELRDDVEHLFPPCSFEEAQALALGGDGVVELLCKRDELTELQAASTVRALGIIGTRRARRALLFFAADPRKRVVAELVRFVNPLEVEQVRRKLAAGERLPRSVAERIRDLAPLYEVVLGPEVYLTGINARELSPLEAQTQVRVLDLSQSPVSDLSALHSLTNLEELVLSYTMVRDVRPLSGLQYLARLDLDYSRVGEVDALGTLPQLQILRMAGTRVRDLGRLAECHKLRSIDLRETKAFDLTPLQHLPLKEIHLSKRFAAEYKIPSGLATYRRFW